MAQITIFTAASALQGPKVRSKHTNKSASLYRELNGVFSCINFVLPRAPFPHNIERDHAELKMCKIYESIIAERRAGKCPPTTNMMRRLMMCAGFRI